MHTWHYTENRSSKLPETKIQLDSHEGTFDRHVHAACLVSCHVDYLQAKCENHFPLIYQLFLQPQTSSCTLCVILQVENCVSPVHAVVCFIFFFLPKSVCSDH